jgi:hypothetical protein
VEGVRGHDGAASISFALPIPPAVASPNLRSHWGTKARKIAAYRGTCAYLMIVERNKIRWQQLDRAIVDVEYYAARDYCKRDNTYHPRDEDNARAALKSAFDALKDARIIGSDAKDRLRWGTFTLITQRRQLERLGLSHGVTLKVSPWPPNSTGA